MGKLKKYVMTVIDSEWRGAKIVVIKLGLANIYIRK